MVRITKEFLKWLENNPDAATGIKGLMDRRKNAVLAKEAASSSHGTHIDGIANSGESFEFTFLNDTMSDRISEPNNLIVKALGSEIAAIDGELLALGIRLDV